MNTPPDDRYTKQELKEIAENYRQEQKQQYAKRQEEKFNRLATYSLDSENQKKYRLKAKEWKRVRFRTGNQSPIEYAADKGAYSSKFSDVTRQRLDNAKSKDYSIEKLSKIKIGEKTNEADGINVIHNNSIRKIEVAELLKPIFKEKITFVPEVKGKYKGVKTSDYLIGDERWDLKELKGESKDTVRNAISISPFTDKENDYLLRTPKMNSEYETTEECAKEHSKLQRKGVKWVDYPNIWC